MKMLEITVGQSEGDLTGSTNEVIQAAIDRAGSVGGGIVRLLPGTYVMNDSLHLRSGVTLRGSGSETVLWKPPSFESLVIHNNGYGLFAVQVAEPEKFAIGTGIYITDDNNLRGGFFDTVATVCWKRGNELGLNRSLNGDIRVLDNGRVTSVYPIISGYDLENAVVESLVIDGNAEHNAHLHGCRGGGIFLLRADHVHIIEVTVRNYNGDGVSFQQCINTVVERCLCTNNTGSGLHPGSGSVGFVIRGTTSSNNGTDGIYYCLRVSYSLCEDCIIEGNGLNGLSIGHMDTDAIIRRNRIAGNASNGIWIRDDPNHQSGLRTIVEDNTFHGNCHNSGAGEIYIASKATDLYIVRNAFQTSQGNERNLPAVYLDEPFPSIVPGPPASIVIYANEAGNRILAKAAKDEYMAWISYEEPKFSLAVGPDNATTDATRHLRGSRR